MTDSGWPSTRIVSVVLDSGRQRDEAHAVEVVDQRAEGGGDGGIRNGDVRRGQDDAAPLLGSELALRDHQLGEDAYGGIRRTDRRRGVEQCPGGAHHDGRHGTVVSEVDLDASVVSTNPPMLPSS